MAAIFDLSLTQIIIIIIIIIIRVVNKRLVFHVLWRIASAEQSRITEGMHDDKVQFLDVVWKLESLKDQLPKVRQIYTMIWCSLQFLFWKCVWVYV